MSVNNLVISDFATGYQTNIAPAKLSNDAFPTLEDALIWRNRLKQKDGVKLVGRLRREIEFTLGSTDGAGAFSGNIITIASLETTANFEGESFSIVIGAATLTDNGLGVLAGGGATGTINYATGDITIASAPAATYIVATFAYYPGLPVMGLPNFDTTQLNIEENLAFDTKYAYKFVTTQYEDESFYKSTSTPRPAVTWTGANYQQFDTFNYRNVLWTTNNVPGQHVISVTVSGFVSPTVTTTAAHGLSNGMVVSFVSSTIVAGIIAFPFVISNVTANTFDISPATAPGPAIGDGIMVVGGSLTGTGDGIRWYDGTGFVNFQPPLNLNANPALADIVYLRGALVGCVFKDRTIFFNTVEAKQGVSNVNAQRYPQRVRWSQNGTPFWGQNPTGQVVDPYSWDETKPGRGGYIDVPTNEFITSIAQNKDVVLIYCERSTFRLVYTGNEVLPFVFQKINDQLGVESTFSTVQFDKYAMGFGQTGVHESTTTDILRVDERIPSEIFKIKNTDFGPQRVSGNINYFEEIVYFAYPDATITSLNNETFPYPNRILVYNYVNKSFAKYRDNVTALGYSYLKIDQSITWNTEITWGEADFEWGSAEQITGYRNSIGGNQKGYVFAFLLGLNVNDAQLNITAVNNTTGALTVTDHGFDEGAAIRITGCVGTSGINDYNYIVSIIDNDTVTVTKADGSPLGWSGTYLGLGQITKIIVPNVVTKDFNYFLQSPISIRINEIDFYVAQSSGGSFVCNIYDNTTLGNPINGDITTNLGTVTTINNIDYSDSNLVSTSPSQLLIGNQSQEYVWSILQNSVQGQSLRMQLTLDTRQIANYATESYAQMIIQAIVIQYTSSGRLIQ
jgi:hypothetical protein